MNLKYGFSGILFLNVESTTNKIMFFDTQKYYLILLLLS